MKRIGNLIVLFFSACTPTSPLTSSRWSGKGERPPINVELARSASVSSVGEKIQIHQQTHDGFRVDDSFVKTIHKNSDEITFQSSAVVEKISALKDFQISRLDKNKTNIWSRFLKDHPLYSTEKIISPVEVILSTQPKLKPILQILTETKRGQIRSLRLSDQGEIISDQFVGSNLTDMVETPSLAFELGPKKGDLRSILLNRKILPEGLSNSIIEVSSQSPNKITFPGSLEYSTTDDRFDQVQAFYYSHQIMRWFNQKVNLNFSFPIRIVTHLGFPEKTNAAFYFQNQIRLGSGDDQVYSHIAWDPSIVMHETSHAVIDALSRLPFQGEGGSINEGFADTFTTFYLNSAFLAENAYLLAPFKRTVEQNLKVGEKNGGLYHDSAIVSGFFWNLRKQIGEDKTLKLVMRVLNRLGPNSDFKDFKTTLQEQTDELFNEKSFNSDDLKKIHQSMTERELI